MNRIYTLDYAEMEPEVRDIMHKYRDYLRRFSFTSILGLEMNNLITTQIKETE